MVKSAKDWPWSSYRQTAGLSNTTAWLSTDWLLSGFSSRLGQAQEQYRQFVSEGRGLPSPWENLTNQVFLGDDAFVSRMQAEIKSDRSLAEVPMAQKRRPALPVCVLPHVCEARARVFLRKKVVYTSESPPLRYHLRAGQIQLLIKLLMGSNRNAQDIQTDQ